MIQTWATKSVSVLELIKKKQSLSPFIREYEEKYKKFLSEQNFDYMILLNQIIEGINQQSKKKKT